jgi:hypothetical protein
MAIRQHGIASKILSGPACTLSVMVTDPHPPDPGEDRKVNQLNAESEESSKPDDEKLHQAADALDSVAEHDSEYRRYAAARDVFVDHRMVDDESDDTDSGNHLTLEHRAAWWSLRYQLDFDRSSGSERVRLLPEFRGPDSTNPPDTRSVDSTIVATWRGLAGLVQHAPTRARLHHLLFQVGGGDRLNHARAAIAAYIDASALEARNYDAVADCRAAIRLSRAINDDTTLSTSIDQLCVLVERLLGQDDPPFGSVVSALITLTGEGSPGTTTRLLATAEKKWPDPTQRDRILNLALESATSPSERAEIWRRRVHTFLDRADSETNNIMRATRLHQAVELAERSNDPALRNEATVRLQQVRELDLEMMHLTASSRQFQEEWDSCVDAVLGTDTSTRPTAEAGDAPDEPSANWSEALSAFASFTTVTGPIATTERRVREQYALAPLTALFSTQLQTPEGLPLWAPTTDAERLDMDMVKWETQLLGHWAPIFAAALHEIVHRFGTPPAENLHHVLNIGPAMTSDTSTRLCRALFRFWSGDPEAAAYTTTPVIESMLRTAVLAADQGIYRLQQGQSPGQYVGLGVMLNLFCTEYDVPEDDRRMFNAICNHPAGWNTRNLLAHGYVKNVDSGVAAVLIHIALRIVVLAANKTQPTPE